MEGRMYQELMALPGLQQLTASQARELPWRVKELVLIALFREQVSSTDVAEELQTKSRDRRQERKADKLLDDVDRSALRKKEESFRADFMQVAANELARLGAPVLITWQKLVFDKECCVQAFRLLLTRMKSSRQCGTSGVSTNSSSLLAARYAAAARESLRRGRNLRGSNKTVEDEECGGDGYLNEDLREEPAERTKFPQLHSTQDPLPRHSAPRQKRANSAAKSAFTSRSSTLDWNFDTSVDSPLGKDRDNGFDVCESADKLTRSVHVARLPGADIAIERTLPSKSPSYFASKFKKNQVQALQEENTTLNNENAKLREEIKQLEALNVVLQNDNSNKSLLDESSEFTRRRMRLLQAQNIQLQRQISLQQDALLAHENAGTDLLSALHNWYGVIDAGREEAKAAGADQNATNSDSEAGERKSQQTIKWMMAVPDKLMDELKRVEGQIRAASIAANRSFETKLRVSTLSASFLRAGDTSMRMSDIHGRESLNLAHLRLDRIKQVEDALACVADELDNLRVHLLERFPPKISSTDPTRLVTHELTRSVQQLILEVGAFGVVVSTPSANVSGVQSARTTIDSELISASDVIKALSSVSGVAKGASGAKEREKHAKVMLKKMDARYAALDKEIAICRREAEYWRAGWDTQDQILQQLAKRVRQLGQKKVEWCHQNLLAPMDNLAEVFTSFLQAYDENTTRQNPYLPLLVEMLSEEQPILKKALFQWQDYSREVQSKLDKLIADYEANELVLAEALSAGRKARKATLYSEYNKVTLPSSSEQVPVH